MSNIEFEQDLQAITDKIHESNIEFETELQTICNKFDFLPNRIKTKWIESYKVYFRLQGNGFVSFNFEFFVIYYDEIKTIFNAYPSLN